MVDVVACADLVPERSRAAVDRFGVPAAVSTEDLLSDAEIELVINLTNPAAHAEVSLAAIEAGKHVYSEKPLAVERADGQAIIDSADGERAVGRLRARHRSRSRHPDMPQGDRRRAASASR